MRSMATHHHRPTLHRWLLVTALVAGLSATPAFVLPAQAAGGGFVDNFDGFNTGRWYKADGYSNGTMFNAGWRADHVWFSGGVMGLNLNTPPARAACSGKPYASGEYRTTDLYSYGRYEARLKAARARRDRQLVLHLHRAQRRPALGRDRRRDPGQEHQADADQLLHQRCRWPRVRDQPRLRRRGRLPQLRLRVVERRHHQLVRRRPLVHQENGSRGPLPTHPQRIMMNLWPGIGVDSWLGQFTYPGSAPPPTTG